MPPQTTRDHSTTPVGVFWLTFVIPTSRPRRARLAENASEGSSVINRGKDIGARGRFKKKGSVRWLRRSFAASDLFFLSAVVPIPTWLRTWPRTSGLPRGLGGNCGDGGVLTRGGGAASLCFGSEGGTS